MIVVAIAVVVAIVAMVVFRWLYPSQYAKYSAWSASYSRKVAPIMLVLAAILAVLAVLDFKQGGKPYGSLVGVAAFLFAGVYPFVAKRGSDESHRTP